MRIEVQAGSNRRVEGLALCSRAFVCPFFLDCLQTSAHAPDEGVCQIVSASNCHRKESLLDERCRRLRHSIMRRRQRRFIISLDGHNIASVKDARKHFRIMLPRLCFPDPLPLSSAPIVTRQKFKRIRLRHPIPRQRRPKRRRPLRRPGPPAIQPHAKIIRQP